MPAALGQGLLAFWYAQDDVTFRSAIPGIPDFTTAADGAKYTGYKGIAFGNTANVAAQSGSVIQSTNYKPTVAMTVLCEGVPLSPGATGFSWGTENSSDGWGCYADSTDLHVYCRVGAAFADQIFNNSAVDQQWGFTYGGGTFQAISNARVVNTQSIAGTITQSTTGLAINDQHAGAGIGGQGYVRYLAIWNRVLRPGELQAMLVNPWQALVIPQRRLWLNAVATGIAFDAAANSGDQAAASSYSGSASWSGSNRFLAVDVSMLGAGVTVTAMTYGGAPCTKIGAQATVTSFGSVESWGIKQADVGAPPAGSNTLAVTLSGSLEFSVEWVSYTGVEQIGPTEAFNSAQATNIGAADATVNITTVTDNDWVHAAVVASDTSITAGNTTRNNISGTLGSGGNEDNNAPKTPAGVVTMSYTGVGAAVTWAIAGYGIRPTGSDTLMGQVLQ